MRLTETLRSVFYSVGANKFRVLLTSLGIIIGSFTIIMVVGIGKAGQDSVSEQYKRLSVETITISRAMGGGMMVRGGATASVTTLTKQQVLDMEELEHVKSVGISVSTSTTAAYGQASETVTIMGINEVYQAITHLDLAMGEFFTDDDGAARRKVCALGYNVAQLLFGDDWQNCVGESIKLKGLTFEVVGVIARIGGSAGLSSSGRPGSSSSPDDMIYVPYDVAVKYTTGGSTSGMARMRAMADGGGASYVVLANDIDSVSLAVEEIKDYIYGITGSDSLYTVADAGSTLSSALETANTMSTLLIAVAAIVLVVSGIGIMNVLMVSVKERVKEIGILKSIGASRSVILLEFLLEAVFISVMGGVFGMALSFLAPKLLEFFKIDYAFSPSGLVLGFVFSAATGIFFGFYPAWKASSLKPIDALNTE
ncbi:MAG: ABC transporter permease [Oscillospiraceae bacterium]|jgi:putative ABC transport system permease protein|nr:ABC transporter permease [Oscillospiraceae bacterium]